MVTLKGLLINFIDKSKYKKDDGLEVETKAKLQVLVEVVRANGNKVKELHNISIPDSKIALYKSKVSKDIEVEVGIISSKYSFYGL